MDVECWFDLRMFMGLGGRSANPTYSNARRCKTQRGSYPNIYRKNLMERLAGRVCKLVGRIWKNLLNFKMLAMASDFYR
jgi:hypothetical protein